jgi:hypothetical protein
MTDTFGLANSKVSTVKGSNNANVIVISESGTAPIMLEGVTCSTNNIVSITFDLETGHYEAADKLKAMKLVLKASGADIYYGSDEATMSQGSASTQRAQGKVYDGLVTTVDYALNKLLLLRKGSGTAYCDVQLLCEPADKADF